MSNAYTTCLDVSFQHEDFHYLFCSPRNEGNVGLKLNTYHFACRISCLGYKDFSLSWLASTLYFHSLGFAGHFSLSFPGQQGCAVPNQSPCLSLLQRHQPHDCPIAFRLPIVCHDRLYTASPAHFLYSDSYTVSLSLCSTCLICASWLCSRYIINSCYILVSRPISVGLATCF